MVWKAVQPLLNERTREKITISSSVPTEAMVQVLGGEAALQAVLDSVPDPSRRKGK